MAARLKAYRKAKGLTQEALAADWDVDVRSIRRWEQGAGRPADWMRRQIAKTESPLDWPSVSALRELIEARNGPAMIFDDSMRVLTASRPHAKWVYETYGVDAVGLDWHKYMSDEANAMFQSQGGLTHMVRNGLMCFRGMYCDPGGADDGFVPTAMFLDATIIRIPDYGGICMVMAREPRPGEPLDMLAPYFMD